MKKGGIIIKIISVTKENLEDEHICCAISNNKDCQVISKKEWLGKRLEEGLVFPSENAWAPIEGDFI